MCESGVKLHALNCDVDLTRHTICALFLRRPSTACTLQNDGSARSAPCVLFRHNMQNARSTRCACYGRRKLLVVASVVVELLRELDTEGRFNECAPVAVGPVAS